MKKFHTFHIQGCDAVLGYMPNEIAQRFSSLADHNWIINSDSRTVTLATTVDATSEDRTKIVADTLDKMRNAKTFKVLDGWRSELYPVYGRDGVLLVQIERSACPLFGVTSYGTHMTGYVKDEKEKYGLKIWVPRRSVDKQTFSGMCDNTAAGGMTTGETPLQCAIREAKEEASLEERLTEKRLKPVGCLSYIYVRDKKAGGETGLIQPEVEYIYDIELDADTEVKPNDGEVQNFKLLTVDEVKEFLANGEFKANSGIVIVDFLIRHGILTCEEVPGYADMLTRMHRRLEFPTISHDTSITRNATANVH